MGERFNAFCVYYLLCVLGPTQFYCSIWQAFGMIWDERAVKAINRIGRILFSILNFPSVYEYLLFVVTRASRSQLVVLKANKCHCRFKENGISTLWSVHRFLDAWQRADKVHTHTHRMRQLWNYSLCRTVYRCLIINRTVRNEMVFSENCVESVNKSLSSINDVDGFIWYWNLLYGWWCLFPSAASYLLTILPDPSNI